METAAAGEETLIAVETNPGDTVSSSNRDERTTCGWSQRQLLLGPRSKRPTMMLRSIVLRYISCVDCTEPDSTRVIRESERQTGNSHFATLPDWPPKDGDPPPGSYKAPIVQAKVGCRLHLRLRRPYMFGRTFSCNTVHARGWEKTFIFVIVTPCFDEGC